MEALLGKCIYHQSFRMSSISVSFRQIRPQRVVPTLDYATRGHVAKCRANGTRDERPRAIMPRLGYLIKRP
jgi:hypothetical protein